MLTLINLSKKEHSYMFGFLQGDGHLYQNRDNENKGQLCVEINTVDRPILEIFQGMFNIYSSIIERVRDTNFKTNCMSSVWSVCNKQFRDELVILGLPIGKKFNIIKPPSVEFSREDYFRGLIDADGSVGFDKRGLPFLSLTTSSDEIADAYMKFLEGITGKKKQQCRNKRDDVYNVMIWKEDAQRAVEIIYYTDCLALERKYEKAQRVKTWSRPHDMKLVASHKGWTPDQDEFLLTHSNAEAMLYLERNYNSVNLRRGRLQRASKIKQLVTD